MWAESRLVHTVFGTAANVHEAAQDNALLHGDESDAFGDAGYQGAAKRPHADEVRWHTAMRPGKRPSAPRLPVSDSEVRRALELGRSKELERTLLYEQVFAIADG